MQKGEIVKTTPLGMVFIIRVFRMEMLLCFGGPMLSEFLVQLFIGCRTPHKVLHYIPLYCAVAAFIWAITAMIANTDFHMITALLRGIIAVCILSGYVLAVFVCKTRNRDHSQRTT